MVNNRRLAFILVVTWALGCRADIVDFVCTEMGTSNLDRPTRSCLVSSGNLYPATMRPWGFCAWTPQTSPKTSSSWFYDYSDCRIYGIRQTRQPSPWIADHGAWTFLPVVGEPAEDESKRFSCYSHKAETRGPDCYSVYLSDFDISLKLAPALHGGVASVVYPACECPGLVVNPLSGGSAEVTSDRCGIIGRSIWNPRSGNGNAPVRMCFIIRFSQRIIFFRLLKDGALYVKFAPLRRGDSLEMHMASSLISPEQARENLCETQGKDIIAVAAEARSEWESRLSRIKVTSDDLDALRTFYTCYYRTMLFPMATWEKTREGEIVHWSPTVGGIRKGYYYSGTGFWDTFRALFPLLNFLAPDMNARMMEGLQNCWLECGWLPEWSSPGLVDCMIGNNSASVVADAWLSGIRGDFDPQELWKALVHGANTAHPTMKAVGRFGVGYYNSLGYVPRDVGVSESVARTLEYAYDDWCIARFGEAIGRPKGEVEVYLQRSRNWRNVFSSEWNIACGRNLNGSYNGAFNRFAWGGDFTEGCALHYTWSVFHDVLGLMDVMGGEKEFERRLDEIFTLPPTVDCSYYGGVIHEAREMQVANMGQYAHGNQPIQHMAYLYDWCHAWPKAQRRVREVMDRLYHPTPDGYCGDEDNGQTSAWYVWSALGMYPVCPASGEYALGAPRFDRLEVSLPSGALLRVLAIGATSKAVFASAECGGKQLDRPFVDVSTIQKGGDFVFRTE